MEVKNASANGQMEEMDTAADLSRRRFFQLAGGIAGAGLLLSACRRTRDSDVYVGEGDTALLNYLYIIKQVTAAFYAQAAATPYLTATKSEIDLLPDLRDQEIAHREFLKAILGKNNLGTVVPNLSPVTFADKTSFYSHASILEDLSVKAIGGTITRFKSTDYIPVLAKMASVDARHAGYAHDVFSHNAFGDASVIDSNGLNVSISPAAGMTAIGNYLQTKFDTSKLPA